MNTRAALGQEFSATVHFPETDVIVEGRLFLPHKVTQVGGVITVINWGIGPEVYTDAEWRRLTQRLHAGLLLVAVHNDAPTVADRSVTQQVVRNAAIGGAEGVVALLDRLAERSGHAELMGAKLLLWGHSAAGSFALTFATRYPQRTIGFVRYHSHLRELPIDIETAARIPALLLAGESDEVAGVDDTQTLWMRGRMLGAPWTFGIEPGVAHSSLEGLKQANRVTVPWVSAVYHLRQPEGEANLLHTVNERAGWLGDVQTGAISLYASFAGSRQQATWLPDEATAMGWRGVMGFEG